MKAFLLWMIRGYQGYISPTLRPCCRFTPTCSQYALEAIERFGPVKGLWLALMRILRCNPFFRGGYDPVPNDFPSRAKRRQTADGKIKF